MDIFSLNLNTKIVSQANTRPVRHIIDVFARDMKKTLPEGEENIISLAYDTTLGDEDYVVRFTDNDTMNIYASHDLGFIYALLYISETFMYVDPFWFWMDQTIERQEAVNIPAQDYYSAPAKLRFRGWFINDEVLISSWAPEGNADLPWEMAFEAILRCGGNMVIPGTDSNSKKYRRMAADMGLWITHHHAEPLGAEMFARAYPDKEASYKKYPELFRDLWKRAVEEQKEQRTIWNLGFRGQGDRPFWADDPLYDTPQKRGALISEIINEQYRLVSEAVENPVCCTNLYGEITELYRDGFIDIDDSIIKVWSDNGFGKMVARRRGDFNPRTPSLPSDGRGGRHGIYYHVSFYDLQAANHITMLPNTVDFVCDELNGAFASGCRDYLIVNASNIRPHAYYLDAVRRVWYGESFDGEDHSEKFAGKYFDYIDGAAWCYDEYCDSMLSFGPNQDEHCGEQFYTYSVRNMAAQWMKDASEPCPAMKWLTGDADFDAQIERIRGICEDGREGLQRLYNRCADMDADIFEGKKKLFEATIFLQAKIHCMGAQAVIKFCEAYEAFRDGRYMDAFYGLGGAKELFEKINAELRGSEYGIWKGFYENECLSDFKFTAYILRGVMAKVRAFGDGFGYFEWQREVSYSEEDRRVVLITNWENHMTDEELYEKMKNKRSAKK